MFYLILLFLIILIFSLFKKKTKIKIKTFFKKGIKPLSSKYGIYCYYGKQGSGKTTSCVEYLLNNKNENIYANLKSLTGIDYTYIANFKELLELSNKTDIIIFYDEIFTALNKQTKMSTEVLSFISQMRKRRIILLTTAQEWLEINMTLRRYCRFAIACKIKTFLGLNVLIKTFHDAENMTWSQFDNEYVAPLISTTISKLTKEVLEHYDTYEQIQNK